MGGNPFRYCPKLSSISVDTDNPKFSSPDGVLLGNNKTTLYSYPIAKSGTSYTIPSSVTSIGNYAFGYCSSLSSVTIPDGVKTIGTCAFESCSSLTSIEVPSSVKSMGTNPFYHCNKLSSIIVDLNNSNFSSLDEVLFDKTQTTLISYPCAKSGTLYIIPSTVTKIGTSAFAFNKYLTNVTIPLGVKIIETWAFRNCLLTSVKIPSSVTSIGVNPFYNCFNLSSISVDPENLNFYSLDGVLFGNNETTLISYPCAKEDTSYTVPLNVTSIGNYAFSYCKILENVEIPSSVTSIREYAFVSCSNLANIKIFNPDCTIYDHSDTIYSTATIYGYHGSKAEDYATKYKRTSGQPHEKINKTC